LEAGELRVQGQPGKVSEILFQNKQIIIIIINTIGLGALAT
jgi:hypothetical protein